MFSNSVVVLACSGHISNLSVLKWQAKKHKNFSIDEKTKTVKQFHGSQGTKVAFAQFQEILVTTLQSILQKKECNEKNIKKVGEKNAKKCRTLKRLLYGKMRVS